MVRAHPGRLAMRWPGGLHTFSSLDAAANRVARALLAHSVDPTLPVALLFTHGGEALVAILAVLKAGKFYVVLDPGYPTYRLNYMLTDSGATAMVCDAKHHAQAKALCGDSIELIPFDASQEGPADFAPAARPGPDSLAMILYTSGSTGTPKGVVHTHRNVLADVRNVTNGWCVTHHDRWLLYASLSFANSVRTIYGSLLNGGTLYPFDLRQGGFAELADWLIDNRITIIRGVPTFFRNFIASVAEDRTFPAVRILSLGGEPMPCSDLGHFNRHFSAGAVLTHAFGPTECFTVCWALIPHGTAAAEGKLPIGHPLPDKDVLLRDESGREVGSGEVGEIAVRSRYLSLGYWRDPERTRASFLPDPRGGSARIYLTGDLGALAPDGTLIHVGRKDFQTKIRGFRVDVIEIENVLRQTAGIRDAVVAAVELVPGEPRLIGYFVPSAGSSVSSGVLHDALTRVLPDYMIPSAFVALDAIPVTPNGKTDRLRLPLPAHDRRDPETPRRAPASAIDAAIATIWADILGVANVGIDDRFFDLGGDSLYAARIAARVVTEFKLSIPVGVLLATDTVAKMAKAVEAGLASGGKGTADFSQRITRRAPSA